MEFTPRITTAYMENSLHPASSGVEKFRVADPFTVVIFGASGDLSKRKLVPALYHLEKDGYLPDRYAVIGFSRSLPDDDRYRLEMQEVLRASESPDDSATPAAQHLLGALYSLQGDNNNLESFRALRARIEEIEAERQLPGHRIFYLSVAPDYFATIIDNLDAAGLIHAKCEQCWSRVIIEKPFGTDLQSARALNAEITSVLDESQIYRIDHYLGKETVQNILSFRFGNSIFEPMFNQKYVDNVQITVAETLGMEGRRGAYYDRAGAMRDMVQNHMLQLLCLIAMEPPSALDSQSIRDEKVKVLRSLLPMSRKEVAANTVRGQYGVGELNGTVTRGYRTEESVDPRSTTETYVALRTRIDNWRWAGVPFCLRTGKRLRARISEIAVEFKQPPLLLFQSLADQDEFAPPRLRSNVLTLRIQPDEGISLAFACKQPGMRVELANVEMDMVYGDSFHQRSPEAYERLLLDALRGDQALFTRSDEVDYAWRFVSAIHEGWAGLPPPQFPNYYPFTDGPDEAARLMDGTSAKWRPISSPGRA